MVLQSLLAYSANKRGICLKGLEKHILSNKHLVSVYGSVTSGLLVGLIFSMLQSLNICYYMYRREEYYLRTLYEAERIKSM